MNESYSEERFLQVGEANIYYEVAGSGTPLVMIHAGVADNRQWNFEFDYFSDGYQVVRYDMRGYGKSEPAAGKFSHLGDLSKLLESLNFDQQIILMGCSMGGGLAMDFTLAHPEKVRGLIMVGSGPGGLELDVEESDKFSEAIKAFEKGDLDQVAEIETQIWFDGEDRTPDQVNPEMRQLAYEMNRIALGHEVKGLGEKQDTAGDPAYSRLSEIKIPVLIIVGEHDEAYMHGAAEYMKNELELTEIIKIENAAHLPNMDQPDQFASVVSKFIRSLS